jgi:hypothetical protein
MRLVYPWSAHCSQMEDAIEEDEDDLFRIFLVFWLSSRSSEAELIEIVFIMKKGWD